MIKFFISDQAAQLMATKRKSTVGGSTPAISSPTIITPGITAPTISDENTEQDDDELNMADDEEGGTRIGDIYIPPPVKPYCSTESIGPRLIITKISNCNFKSYAGEVVLGPFSNVSFTFKRKTKFYGANVKMFSVFPCYYRTER